MDEDAPLGKLGDSEIQVALDGSDDGIEIHGPGHLQCVGISEAIATDSPARIGLPRQDRVQDVNDGILRPLGTRWQGSQRSF
jgi:hypothetical protein